MAEVLLVNSYFLAFDPKQRDDHRPYPPLATLFAASLLRKEGHTVTLKDSVFASGPEDLFTAIDSHAGKPFVICDDGFNYLTKMCLVNMRQACFSMIGHAKARGCTVIVSSSDATDHWQDYLDKGADFIVVGEAEITLKELVAALDNGTDTSLIPGLRTGARGNYHSTPARVVLKDLDTLPPPAWDLIDLTPYRNEWQTHWGFFSLNVVTTRGCPFKCNWCAKPIYGNRYNAHSPEFVIDQIELLVHNAGAAHIWFCDDIFGLKPGWIHAFRQEMEARSLKVRFKIQCRADLLLNEDNIADLAAAGCEEVWIGAESGSQQILYAMDKGTTIAQIEESTRLMKKHGIRPCFFLQFGYPGEAMPEIRQTIRMMQELLPYDIGVSVSYPLPGTVFYDRVKQEMDIKTNWDHSDELAMMFTGTYSKEFYKSLHRYVHKLFRRTQALAALTGREPFDKNALKRLILLPYYIAGTVYFGYKVRKLSAE